MEQATFEKPGIEEWLATANTVIDRLTECVKVYKRPPHVDAFMPDAERQHKTADVVKLLHRIHLLIDHSEIPTTSVHDAHAHDERLVDGFVVLFKETLAMLPMLSADMQKLLKSPWQHNFPNPAARVLFAGEESESQGIGSGYAAQGRLPEALTLMLEREQMGDNRHPRQELLRHGEPRRHDQEARQRWMEQNSRFLRTAGRVE